MSMKSYSCKLGCLNIEAVDKMATQIATPGGSDGKKINK